MNETPNDLPSPEPVKGIPPPQVAQTNRPPGWWSLPALSGTREGVSKAVQASGIPEHWKAAILAQIATIEPEMNMVRLDAHQTGQTGKADLYLSITPSKGLL